MSQFRPPRPVITLSLLIALLAVFGVTSAAAQQFPATADTVAWSPDGTKIALAGGSGTCTDIPVDDFAVYVLDIVIHQVLKKLSDHTCDVFSVAWSPDGTKLASSSIDGKAKVWDVASGKLITTTKEFALA
jgi:WD40 repeat protein